MKSKKPAVRQVRKSSAAVRREPDIVERAVVLDFNLGRIEAFNREQGGGVSVRKDRNGYTLIRDDTSEPLARLRARGSSGNFEILCWHRATERWRKTGAFGGMILPLDDALEFIADDPMECFWT